MKTPLSHIIPNEINDVIYSPTELSDLKQSLITNGQLEPLVVNEQFKIISGHRRYYSMVQLAWKECEVRKVEYENDIIALIEYNRHRVKSVNDIINEARYLEKELKEKFGGRGRRNDLNNNGGKFLVAKEIADKLGIGLTQLKKINTINNYEPTLLEKIDTKELSVNKAYEIVREKHFKIEKKTTTDDFGKDFKKLLSKHQPTKEQILDTLKSTYPYSLEDFTTKDKSVSSSQNKKKELN